MGKKKKYYNRNKQNLPLSLRIIRGGIGKEFVIKHYDYGIIKTKFPDMSRIIASEAQRKCRNLFRQAVKWANTVMRDHEQKKVWLKKVRRKHRLFNQLIKHYMLKEKKALKNRLYLAEKMIRNAFSAGAGRDRSPAETGQELLVFPLVAFSDLPGSPILDAPLATIPWYRDG